MLQIVRIAVDGVRQDLAVVSEVSDCRVLRPLCQLAREPFEIQLAPGLVQVVSLPVEQVQTDAVEPAPALKIRRPSEYAGMPGRVMSVRTIGLRKQARLDHGWDAGVEVRPVVPIHSGYRRGERTGGTFRGKHCCWKEVRDAQHRS